MCNRKIKKLLIVVLLIMLLTSCVNKSYVQTEEVTTTVSEETVTEGKTDFSGKTASDMSENEILEMGDNLALEFQRIGSNYFSVLMYDHVIVEENKNEDINYPYICKLPEYKDLDELFADIYSCMTPDILENSLGGKDFYAEYDGEIYCKEKNSGWVYTSDCVISGYEIIDENTIEFSLWIKEDENLDAHSSSFVVKNINGWKISEIDKETANKIIFQYSPINNEPKVNRMLIEFDWADEDILMSHELKPFDSGAGWKFFVSDIDFDANPEILVSFASNGGGNNSLYIYKSENGVVKHYADIIATPKEKLGDIGNIAVKEYANTDIIDAYKNADGNYRYLTTDIASVSGITTVTIYEIDFEEEYAEYKEIAKCEFPYSIPEGEEEFINEYFLSEKCDGELSEKMNEYMKGYEKTEMPVLASEVSFPRDIVSYTDEEKKEILSELHKDIEKILY